MSLRRTPFNSQILLAIIYLLLFLLTPSLSRSSPLRAWNTTGTSVGHLTDLPLIFSQHRSGDPHPGAPRLEGILNRYRHRSKDRLRQRQSLRPEPPNLTTINHGESECRVQCEEGTRCCMRCLDDSVISSPFWLYHWPNRDVNDRHLAWDEVKQDDSALTCKPVNVPTTGEDDAGVYYQTCLGDKIRSTVFELSWASEWFMEDLREGPPEDKATASSGECLLGSSWQWVVLFTFAGVGFVSTLMATGQGINATRRVWKQRAKRKNKRLEVRELIEMTSELWTVSECED